MKHLYVIGNGFDICHKIPTSYTDFRVWLQKNDVEAYEWMHELYVIDETWWNGFERNLVNLNIHEKIVDIAQRNPVCYTVEKFRESDRFNGAFEAIEMLKKFMTRILEDFNRWIESIDISKIKNKIQLDSAAEYISFNYTLTLEKVYNISPNKICHIHGCLGKNNYIVGHKKSQEEIEQYIRQQEKRPKNMTEEEYRNWCITNYDEAYENEIATVVYELAQYRKDVASIISKNNDFFKTTDVELITILGYSFSDIDNPYISKIINSSHGKSKLKFEVSTYSEDDEKNARKFFDANGIIENQFLPFIKI